VVNKLNAELNKALPNISVLKRFLDFGMAPVPGRPEQFRAFARAESKRWGAMPLQQAHPQLAAGQPTDGAT
jgi:hypothetical protein